MSFLSGWKARALARIDAVAFSLAACQVALWWLVWPSCREILRETNVAVAFFTTFVLGGLLNIAVIVAIFVQLARAHEQLGRREASPLRAFALWAASLLVVLVALAPAREWVAGMFGSATARFAAVDRPFGFVLGDFEDSERALFHEWVEDWESGRVLGKEILLALLLAGIQVGVALKLGAKERYQSVLIAGLATLLACGLLGLVFGLVFRGSDTFYLGTLAGPLATDLLMPGLQWPETPVAALFQLAFAAATWTVVRSSASSREGALRSVVHA